MTFWYLATPYARYAEGPEAAFEDAARIAGNLMLAGVPVFSPIAHTHPIAEVCGMFDQPHEFWMAVDKPMVDAARGVIVATLPGYAQSKGVQMEVAWAHNAGKPVIFLDPEFSPADLEQLR